MATLGLVNILTESLIDDRQENPITYFRFCLRIYLSLETFAISVTIQMEAFQEVKAVEPRSPELGTPEVFLDEAGGPPLLIGKIDHSIALSLMTEGILKVLIG